jgi:hypothetical protein
VPPVFNSDDLLELEELKLDEELDSELELRELLDEELSLIE